MVRNEVMLPMAITDTLPERFGPSQLSCQLLSDTLVLFTAADKDKHLNTLDVDVVFLVTAATRFPLLLISSHRTAADWIFPLSLNNNNHVNH